MSIHVIVCNCQHCDEQQFQTLSCVHYTIFSVVKLDLFIRALLLTGSHSSSGKNYAYASRTSCYYLFSMLGPFCNVFLLMHGGGGVFFTMWKPFCYFFSFFLSLWRAFLWACPLHIPYENFR